MKFIQIGRSYINVDSITAVRNTEGEYASHRTEVYTTKGEYHTNEFITSILSQIENPLTLEKVRKNEEEYLMRRYSVYNWKINQTGKYKTKGGKEVYINDIDYEYKKAYTDLKGYFGERLMYNAETGEFLSYDNEEDDIE